jgi:ketosteroid isomerase-like protein
VSDVVALLERLRDAMNAHDLDAMVACIHPDYRSEQPAHPDRAFGGRDQVRQNYGALFAEIPDFRAELLRSAACGDEFLSEWRMHGTRTDGTSFEYPGMAAWGVRDGLLAWGRLYFEPVEPGGAGIDASIRRLTRPKV